MKPVLLALALAAGLSACASLRHARADSVLWISGLLDRAGSPGLAALADARGEPLLAHDGAAQGNPAAIVGHSLGADAAARMAANHCPRLVILLDPTEAAPAPRCPEVHQILSSWGKSPVLDGATVWVVPSDHVGLPEKAAPIIERLLKEAGL